MNHYKMMLKNIKLSVRAITWSQAAAVDWREESEEGNQQLESSEIIWWCRVKEKKVKIVE